MTDDATAADLPTKPRAPLPGRLRWWPRWDAPALAALVLGTAGVVLRLVLLLREVPSSDSDEATMGLAALHIANGRDFPAFFYGQNYMGTIEAWLAAPIMLTFGPSTLALRLPTLPMYAAFVFLGYQLARRLYTPWVAVATVAVLALGSYRVVKNQLYAAGGYPEISPLAVALFLLALARPRRLTVGAFGLVLGLLIWDDWIILPYAAAAAVVLWLRCRGDRRLLRIAGIMTVVGALPEATVLLHPAGHYGPAGGIGIHLYQGVLLGVPVGTGLCGTHCAGWQMWWGVVYPVLLVVAGVLAVRAVRGVRGRLDPDDLAQRVARLGLVIAAAFTLVAYLRSNRAVDDPIDSSRYLSTLLISTPAILAVLLLRPYRRGPQGTLEAETAYGWSRGPWADRLSTPPARWLGGAVVAALLATMGVATTQLVASAPGFDRRTQDMNSLVAGLSARGIDRVYGEYWTCNLLTFKTAEQVVCATVNTDLSPGLTNYPAYRTMVEQSGDARYVAIEGGDLDQALRETRTLDFATDGYRVYR